MSEESLPKEKTHPLRKWWVWVIIVGGPFILIPAIAILIYNHHAREKFEEHVKALDAAGETLDVSELIPPNIDDPAENFAKAEIIDSLKDADNHLPDPFPQLRVELIPDYDLSGRSNAVRHAGSSRLADKFEELTEKQAAEVVLDYCSQFSTTFDELKLAARRPNCDFERDYSRGLALTMPELNPLQKASSLLRLRSLARLQTGDTFGAAEDLITILQIGNHIGRDPGLISQLVSILHVDLATSVLRTGIAKDLWDEPSLNFILENWPENNFQQGLLQSYRFERAVYTSFMIDLNGVDRSKYFYQMGYSFAGVKPPSGFIYENATLFSTLFQDEILTDTSGSPRRDSITAATNLEARVSSLRANRIQAMRYSLVLTALPVYDSIALKVLRTEALSYHAQIAVHLELEKLRQGSYPETLSAIPETLSSASTSFGSIHYNRFEDGNYHLYTIGPDGIDNDGLIRHDAKRGDWVWRPVLPDDFGYDDYRGR